MEWLFVVHIEPLLIEPDVLVLMHAAVLALVVGALPYRL